MVVEPDQGEQVALDPRALDALAEAGRAAARGARIGEVAGAVVEATARATGAALVVTRGVAAASRALAAELEGRRVSADGWTLDETALANAPDVVRALAARIGAESALVVPIEARGAVAGSIELYGADDSVDGVGTTTARIAATQLALAVHARLGSPERNGAASDAFRLAADAVAAGGDVAKVETTILRLAIELAHADGAALWRIDESGERERVAAIGDVPDLPPSLSPGAAEHERGAIVIVPLHEHDVLGVVVRTPSPDPAAVERLQQFGQRAAQALRTAATTRALAAELE